MRWILRALAASALLAAGMGNAQAPAPKLALVIGNADYDADGRVDISPAAKALAEAAGLAPDLGNTVNDATDIGEALRRVGFRVQLETNLSRPAMMAALAKFGADVSSAGATAQVLVYFAGHAIQVDGRNFLLPTEVRLPAIDYARTSAQDMRAILGQLAVPVDEVTTRFQRPSEPGVNVLLLDSCRSNPWEMAGGAVAEGLAGIYAPPRTVVGFATEPGKTALDGFGRNSPYAKALKLWIGRPGTVLEMLDAVGDEVQIATGGRQVPWTQASSIRDTCLASCPPDSDAASRELAAARQRLATLTPAQLEAMDRDVAVRYLTATIESLEGYVGPKEDAFGASLEGYLDIDRTTNFLLRRRARDITAAATPEQLRELRGLVREYFVVSASPILVGVRNVRVIDSRIVRRSETVSDATVRANGQTVNGSRPLSFAVRLTKIGVNAWVVADYGLDIDGATIWMMTAAAYDFEARPPTTVVDAINTLKLRIERERLRAARDESRRSGSP